jgi:hypothetical protein
MKRRWDAVLPIVLFSKTMGRNLFVQHIARLLEALEHLLAWLDTMLGVPRT